MSQRGGGADKWLRLARKCKDSDLAEYLGKLAIEPNENSHAPAYEIPGYRFEDKEVAQRVGAIISKAAAGDQRRG